MRRDHFCFFLFLMLLLIAPKISLPSAGGLDKSISAGAIGLVCWALVSPTYLIKFKKPNSKAALAMVLFGYYILFVSIISAKPISIAYAIQYFFYLLLGYIMISAYSDRAVCLGQTHTIYKIIGFVGLIYAAGVLISVWTGPIYPSQTLDTARIWSGVFIQQGVGFSESQNIAGGVLIVLVALSIFVLNRENNKTRWCLSGVYIIALLLTISRSAIFSFFVSLAMYYLLRVLSMPFQTQPKSRWVIVLTFGLLFFVLIGSTALLLSPQLLKIPEVGSLAEGIGLKSSKVVAGDVSTRLGLWMNGVNTWAQSDTLQQIFGSGFRNSMTLVDGTTWITAHNAYISLLGDTGLVGLLFFITPLIILLAVLGKQLLTSEYSGVKCFGFVALLGLMIHNMTEVFFYSPVIISITLIVVIIVSTDSIKVCNSCSAIRTNNISVEGSCEKYY